jgi:RNA polymerase sigma-70 factor (ECF subfamily)
MVKEAAKMTDVSDFIPTRESLLSRLRDWNDQDSWRVFFETYWKLIYNSATKAGLSDSEAQDAVQETVISVMKNIGDFRYDAKKGSFKAWLLRLSRWRAMDQLRKRQQRTVGETDADESSEAERAGVIDATMIAADSEFEIAWEAEWENNLLEAAIDRVKKKVDPKHFQVFHLYVQQGWPVLKVARTLKVNAGRVYLIKHRIGNAIKNELRNMKDNPI